MELNDFMTKAMSTCMESSDNWEYMHNGLNEEVGEFNGVVSKAVRKKLIVINNNQLLFTKDATIDDRIEIEKNLKKELVMFFGWLLDVQECWVCLLKMWLRLILKSWQTERSVM